MIVAAKRKTYDAAHELAAELKKPENAGIYAAMEWTRSAGQPLAFKTQLALHGSSVQAWDALVRKVGEKNVLPSADVWWLGAMAYSILFEQGIQLAEDMG